jgi:hypothetical protein
MRAEERVRPQFAAVAEIGELVFVELRAEGEGVTVGSGFAVLPAHPEAIVETLAPQRHAGLEETVAMVQQIGQRPAAGGIEHFDRVGAGQQRAQPEFAGGIGVQTEHRERIGVTRLQQCRDVPLCEHAQPGIRPGCAAVPAQTLSTYSRTVRSVEKKPMPAMLRSAQAFHAAGSRYSASTRAWVAT